ncbi:MAG: metal-dependent transcriptional regulator [Lachnospiraceae bacterium]|nr:metal-dependent transcriptional regulator [Lachnospiraceae bacterium]
MTKSCSSENYLKSILILLNRKGKVRSVDVAKELGVSKPSVCVAMKKLRQENLIYFNEEGNILFTDLGKDAAEKIYNKHLLLSRMFRSIGVSEHTADNDACLLEHSISDETYECLSRFYWNTLASSAENVG